MPSNRAIIFMIVGAVVVMAISCVITNCWLAFQGKEPPQAFNLLTGGLVASLPAMLVKTSPTQTLHPPPVPGGTPPEVVVVNKPEDPIPTTETQNWNTL
jgi:Na+/proline symporter